jgi:EpsI family protein
MTTAGVIAGLVLLIAAFLFAQIEPLRGMVALWDVSPMYSYGYLVPLVSGYLIWSRRTRLAALPVRPSLLLGGLLIAAWTVMVLGGALTGIQIVQQFALVPGVVGIVLCLFGLAHAKVAWAGLAYLFLMIPIWDGFTEPLHVPFQNVSAAIGVEFVRLAGVPAYRQGTFIDLPTMNIEVARACSGVNYLVAVLALGLPLGYLYLRSPWRRVLLLGVALAVAALSNSLRVALICVLVYFDIGSPLHGPAHVLHGLFVAGVGHAVLLVGLWFLGRSETTPAAAAAPAVDAPPLSTRLRDLRPAIVFGLVALFAAIAAYPRLHEPAPVPLRAAAIALPQTLGDWTADSFASPSSVDWWQGADHQIVLRYRHPSGQSADVLVAYYGVQRQGHEVVTHLAADLHRRSRVQILAVGGGTPVSVNVAEQTVDGRTRVTLFWYELDGIVETRPLRAKLRTAWHAIGRRNTNGTAVLLRSDVPEGTGATALAPLEDLTQRVYAALAGTLPGRTGAGGKV